MPRRAVARGCRWLVSRADSARCGRVPPRKPASCQPIVPLLARHNRVGNAERAAGFRRREMLRVRPAQFTTTTVSGSGAKIADAVDQFPARHGRGRRDRHVAEFVERPAVQHHDVAALVQPRFQAGGVDAWCHGNGAPTHSPNALDGTFTPEKDVNASGRGGPAFPPSSTATSRCNRCWRCHTGEQRAPARPRFVYPRRRCGCRGAAAGRGADLPPRERAGHRPEQMAGGEFAFLAPVQDGQFLAIPHPGMQRLRVDAFHGGLRRAAGAPVNAWQRRVTSAQGDGRPEVSAEARCGVARAAPRAR